MSGQALLVLALEVLVLLAVPVAALVVGIVALVRTSRIARLESRLARLEAVPGAGKPAPAEPPPIPEPAATAEIAGIAEPAKLADRDLVAAPPRGPALRRELFIGQKALGWIAVVLAIFAASFFLEYGGSPELAVIIPGTTAAGSAPRAKWPWPRSPACSSSWPVSAATVAAGGPSLTC
ncbi:MAG: hypothetical protein ACUVYA_04595 [Planctomycetota bacterium]